MKKPVKMFALALCAAGALSLSACSGCGGTPDYKTTISPNWMIRAGSADELDSSSPLFGHEERAVYALSHTGGTNSLFSFSSEGGEYVVTLTADTFDRGAQEVPESVRAEGVTENVYKYSTQLTQPVTYTVGGESYSYTNRVTTVSMFLSAGNNLRPVYSSQTIDCISPANLQPSSIENAYVEMKAEYRTYYNRDGSAAVTISATQDGASEQKSAGTGTEYSLFDSSALTVALRGMTQSGTHAFDVYIPVNGGAARYQAAWGSAAAIDRGDDARAALVAALDKASEAGYLLNGTDDEGATSYSWTPVTVSLVSSMTGPSTTYYIASVNNTDMNAGRAALMRMEETLPFNLGTVTYDLTSLTYTSK